MWAGAWGWFGGPGPENRVWKSEGAGVTCEQGTNTMGTQDAWSGGEIGMVSPSAIGYNRRRLIRAAPIRGVVPRP